jgi:polysaccharide export outer membrane protein
MLMLTAAAVAQSQQSLKGYSDDSNRVPRIRESDSRAEQEADLVVALSADKIISILREETGLLLQVKKLLVRKAYEQGRLLDPEDLNDDVLFRLVRQDVNIRVLITHEIEDRGYIRALPDKQERQQMAEMYTERAMQGLSTQRTQSPTPAVTNDSQTESKPRRSQEDSYWMMHDPDLLAPLPQTSPLYAPTPEQPSSQPPEANPQTPNNNAPQRQVLRTTLQDQMQDQIPDQSGIDSFNGFRTDPVMPRIRPEELPQVLNASATSSSPLTSRLMGNLGQSSIPSISSMAGSMPDGLSVMSGLDLHRDNSQIFPQEPRTDLQPRAIEPMLPRRERQDSLTLRHRPDPYADVPSLYDLYAQYSKRPPILERFGMDVFRNGTGNFNELPMDVPVGPDYVVGPGDGLSIDMWGSISQRLQRVVDREGRVALPEAGTIEVSGRNLGDVQQMVENALRSQYRGAQADVSLARLRTVRVYVVGDVERPGAYDVSSLSTPLNAVFLAGGPTSRGSLRILRHYRAKTLLEEIDVYDLLLHGVRSGLERLQAGDTVLVPPLGAEVMVEGMVRRPAIYELHGESSLAEVLELAGGVLPTGTLRQIDIERLEAHEHRSMLRVDLPEGNNEEAVNKQLDDFQVQNGDKIKISPILPYADKTIYLDGHVFRPGKYAYEKGMRVSDVIHSYNDLLPEPYKQHAEVIRLNLPDYTPEILSFDLDDALSGKEQDIALKPFDTIRIFGRYDFEDPPVITVSGEVRDPGDHVTNGATYLRDVVYLAGGATPDAELNDAQVFRKTQDGRLKVISVNLTKALEGDPSANILLEAKDRVFIHRSMNKFDPPTVMIQGEIARPGKYPLGAGMTAADLVRLAGGLKRGAYTREADLTRYDVVQGSTVVTEHMPVPIARALANEQDTDVRLRDGDVLTIRQLGGWNDVGATIEVKGEVVHPGAYGIEEGERLSSVLQRAGGFRPNAYPYGAILERAQVRDIEAENRAELIREVTDEGTVLKGIPSTDENDKAVKEASIMQWQSTLQQLRDTPPTGRLVIHISSNWRRWAKTSADIQVRKGDILYIPKKPNFVMVDGAVYNPTAVTYKPGKNAGWYLKQAGGPTNMANQRAIFVVRADGSVVGNTHGMFTGGVHEAELRPGDMVVVPQKAFSGNSRWKTTLDAAQVATAIGIGVQVARSF